MKNGFLLFLFFICALTLSGQAPADKSPGGKDNGSILDRYEVVSTTDATKNGHSEKWYKGVKIVSCEYLSGKKNGLWKSQSVDGKIFFQGNYVDDKRNGTWKYFSDQKRLCTGYFKNNSKDSVWQSYYPNGNVQCISNNKNRDESGSYKLFYENGKIKNDRTYKNDSLNGPYLRFHSNGVIVSNIEYKNNMPYEVISMQDSAGKPLEYGTFKHGNGLLIDYTLNGKKRSSTNYLHGQKDGPDTIFFENGLLYRITSYKAGKLEGVLVEYFSNGKVHLTSKYKNNEYVNGSLEYNDNDLNIPDARRIDSMKDDVNTYPVSLGGEAGMMSFIQANVKYPYSSKMDYIQGTVYVTFVVEPDGSISDAKILKGINEEMDAEALRVVSVMPDWIPGFQNGIPERVRFNLPIKYILR